MAQGAEPVEPTTRGARAERPKDDAVGAPGPWDSAWQRKEDATGWETVYRGTGRRRPSKSVLELELSAEQDEWLDDAAETAGITPHELLRQLIDEARRRAPADRPVREPVDAAG